VAPILAGALATGSFTAFGWLVLRLFPLGERSAWERLATAYVLGFGLLPLALLLPAVSGARLAGVTLLAPVAAAAALGIVARGTRRPNARHTACSPRAAATSAPTRRTGELAAIAVLAGVSLLVIALGYALPLYKFDAWAQVGFKAKVFFETRQLDGFFGRDDLLHYQNADYPLLVPLVETWVAILGGRWDEHLVKLPIALLFPALLALFYASAARHLSRGRALVATLALCAVFHFRFYATVGYADLPLALFAFLAFDQLAARPAPERADAILGGIYGGLAAFAKNEGFVVIAGVALVTLARPLLAGADRACGSAAAKSPRAAMTAAVRSAALFVLVALGMNIPWLIFRGAHGLTTALLANGATFDIERLGPVLFAIAREATDWGRWNILWPVTVAAFAIAVARRLSRGARDARESHDPHVTISTATPSEPRTFDAASPPRASSSLAPAAPALPAFALAFAILIAYVGVLLASPFSLEFLVATALERLLIHLVPLAVYATMLTLLGGREANENAARTHAAPRRTRNATTCA